MTVKSIFKILIGTIVLMVGSSLIIELFNVSTSGLQINQTSKMAGRQACVLFTQESYKSHTDGGIVGGAVESSNVYDINGALYVTGEFYTSDNPVDIYNSLYTSAAFKDWMDTDDAVHIGNWYNLKLIDKALNHPSTLNIPFGQPGYNEAMTAKLYKDVMMTPVNLGIPYLDEETLNKMFQWNLAQLLSNCNPNSIRIDEYGKSYVAFRGFRVYADMANISNIEYKTFDMTIPSNKLEFQKITNIDPDNLGFGIDAALQSTVDISEDDRNRICSVGISYNIPMTYEGITPIKQIFNYVWDTEVEGLNGGSGRVTHQQWNDGLVNLESGGLYGNTAAGVLPVPGKLIYYIIR